MNEYTTSDYLSQLQQDREDLVDNLEAQGISDLVGDETFTELVPRVLDIEGGDNKIKYTVSSETPITLPNATNEVLDEAKIYGICTQNGTPTQVSPVDIVCNNGTIKYSANMANVNEQTALVGYYTSSSGVVTADIYNWMYQDFIPVKPNTTYTLTMSSPVYYVSIIEYSTASDSGFVIRKVGSTGSNTTLTITTGATTNYVRFGTNINRTVVTLERVLAINWMLNVGNSMAYQPYVEGGIYIDGTNEVLTMGIQTANVETLLSVGDYKDEQDLISGDIVRNCEAVYYDGTQTINTPYLSTTGGLNVGSIIVHPKTTPTTETTTAQTLTAQQGTNTISSNKGAREMKVKYYATKVLQSKSTTITTNGNTTITPDAGYYGLSNVNITVNVS